jgi:hypothetical protein
MFTHLQIFPNLGQNVHQKSSVIYYGECNVEVLQENTIKFKWTKSQLNIWKNMH